MRDSYGSPRTLTKHGLSFPIELLEPCPLSGNSHAKQFVHKPQARFHQLPRPRPEAHIDTPPLNIRHSQQLRRERLEIDEAFAKRPVRTGFVAMQRPVGI